MKTKTAKKTVKKKVAPTKKKGVNKKSATKKAISKKTAKASAVVSADEFMNSLDHPLKSEIETVRQLILKASPKIRDGVKWNSLSFMTTDWFATVNVRERERVQLVMHTGAKKNEYSKTGIEIADPKGLLTWIAKDRCLLTLEDAADIKAKASALKNLIKAWIKLLPA